MKHKSPKILYFSLDDNRCAAFGKMVQDNKLNYSSKAMFKLLNEHAYKDVGDLVFFLDNYEEDYQSLHVIIDIAAVLDPEKIKKQEDVKRTRIKLIRDLIISYPEVQFIFDRRSGDNHTLTQYIFPKEELPESIREKYQDWFKTTATKVFVKFLELRWDVVESTSKALKDTFYTIICGMDNTFDGTNIRYAIKDWNYLLLRIDKNYGNIQNSRSVNLALCVEEETNQNMFLSYALYKSGYRVLPVTCAAELKKLNEAVNESKCIIFRDFDLQFEDEGKAIDLIRGYKFCDKEEVEIERAKCEEYYSEGWNSMLKVDSLNNIKNRYWKDICDNTTVYVTKGPRNSEIVSPKYFVGAEISEDREILKLGGFRKPVSGIYHAFHEVNEIRRRYDESLQNNMFVTSREGHDHSTPLDIYDLVNSMLKRAERYYASERFRLAALVSSEANEIMNGFHQRLMVKAQYIIAKAENAIAMDVVGGDEAILAADAIFRVEKIRMDVERIYTTDKGVDSAQCINVLNQIFSDCRQYCKDREHFKSEEVFIDAMAKLNDGIDSESPSLFIKEAKEKLKSPQKLLSNVKDNVTMWCTDTINTIIEYGKEKKE